MERDSRARAGLPAHARPRPRPRTRTPAHARPRITRTRTSRARITREARPASRVRWYPLHVTRWPTSGYVRLCARASRSRVTRACARAHHAHARSGVRAQRTVSPPVDTGCPLLGTAWPNPGRVPLAWKFLTLWPSTGSGNPGHDWHGIRCCPAATATVTSALALGCWESGLRGPARLGTLHAAWQRDAAERAGAGTPWGS